MEDLGKYLLEGSLIIVPALWVLGKFLKISELKDNYIIWVLLIIGIGFSAATSGVSVESIMQGIIATGVAVLGHQLLKQTMEM